MLTTLKYIRVMQSKFTNPPPFKADFLFVNDLRFYSVSLTNLTLPADA